MFRRSRCRAEIEAFEAANTNPTIFSTDYVVRSQSPFFVELDQGAVTPMTIVAATEITDCATVCNRGGGSAAAQSGGDKCVAVAGVVGDSDLTVMTYCVPSAPGSGVRRHAEWSVPGTLQIMNAVVDVHFVDFALGAAVAVLREVQVESFSNRFQSEVYVFARGDEYNPLLSVPVVSASSLFGAAVESSAAQQQEVTAVSLIRITGMLVRPIVHPPTTINDPRCVLHVEVAVSVVRTDAFDGKETVATETRSMCGELVVTDHDLQLSPSWSWGATACGRDLWDETRRGHVVWFNGGRSFVVVPAGSLLTTGKSDVRVMRMSQTDFTAEAVLVGSRGFRSSTWTLTSGIPATTKSLDFSLSTGVLVRKTARLSLFSATTGDGGAAAVPETVDIFMTNDPSSPTHWLSRVRLSLPPSQQQQHSHATASTFQSLEVDKTFTLMQKCNYQVRERQILHECSHTAAFIDAAK